MIVTAASTRLLLAALIGFRWIGYTTAAHARKRPTVTAPVRSNPYDKQITTFNEEGHLLQLQYAQEASDKGSKGAFMKYRDYIVVVVENTSVKPGTSASGYASGYVSNGGIVRIHDGIMAKMTGLNGDARVLAKYLLSSSHSICWKNGNGCSSTGPALNVGEDILAAVTVPTREIASVCAELQHSLTMRPGARPLAVQATFFGVDDNHDYDDDEDSTRSGSGSGANNKSKLVLYQCHLSGTFKECEFCVCGGGMHQCLLDLNDLSGDMENILLADVVTRMANILLEILSKNLIALLHVEDDDDEEDASSSSKPTAAVDIYVMKLNPKCRGGMETSFASFVRTKEDLLKVGELFTEFFA